MRVTRRTFLKGAGAAGAVLAADRVVGGPLQTLVSAKGAEEPLVEDWFPTTCWIGKQDCGLLARRLNGRVVKLEGNPASPRNLGTLCPKGVAQIVSLYDPDRVRTPLVRTNDKGVPGTWRRASWDEALELVAERVREVRDHDPSAVLWQKGRSKSKEIYDSALVAALGATKLGHGAYCSDAGYRALEYTVGPTGVLHPDFRYTRLLLSWGWNATNAGGNKFCWIVWNRYLNEARERGLKVVTIDPRIRGMAHFADEWLPIRPGTDLALALALTNVLIENGYVDRPYLRTYTNATHLVGEDGHVLRDGEEPLVWDEATQSAKPASAGGVVPALEGEYEVNGATAKPAFQLLAEHVATMTPERAGEICGLAPEQIQGLGLQIGEQASIGSTIVVDGVSLPYRPVGVMLYHAAQQELGFQATRAIVLMLMVIGAMGAPGGTMPDTKWEINDNYYALDEATIEDPPYGATLKYSKYFPINSGSPSVTALAMLDPDRYGVDHGPEVAIVHMTNPVVSFPNSEVIKAAYAKLSFVAVISPWLSETADLFADVVLPAATLEKYEGPISAGDLYTSAKTMRVPPMEPLFESRGEIDIYLDLTERIGVLYGEGGFLRQLNTYLELPEELALPLDQKPTARDILDRYLLAQGVEDGIAKIEREGVYVSGPVGPDSLYGYATDPPFGGVIHRLYGESLLGYREVMQAMGVEETYWRDYTALPTWRDPTMNSSPSEYDLYLISYKLIEHKQSRTSMNPLLAEVSGPQRLDVNPAAAAARGIAEGDEVWVESHNAVTGETARIRTVARLTETIRPDVVGMPHHFGTWAHPGTGALGPSPNSIFPTGEGYIANTADQSFHVKVRIYRA
jgi:anaerobic selenocysteine-containing dehydrogenase